MDIIIGSAPPLHPGGKPNKQAAACGAVEAELLHVRPARRGIAGPLGMERRQKEVKDPVNGKVITVMVPDSFVLPQDIENLDYKVFLRFQRVKS